jgi:hypothetical protein
VGWDLHVARDQGGSAKLEMAQQAEARGVASMRERCHLKDRRGRLRDCRA